MVTYSNLDEERRNQTLSSTDYSDHLGQYNQAMSQLTQIKQNLPTYDKSYDKALQDLFEEISSYKKFSYNTREDSLYQAYKQSYTDAGRLAMQDTMGQAASLTGGYGSSYGQVVGQQQYNAYLQKLNEVLPETYDMAYQQYRDEKSDLQNQYDMAAQQADSEYQKYKDRLNAHYQELGYWQNMADSAYGRYQYGEEQAYQREQDAYDREQDAYAKQQDAYDRLADMIVTMGYTPTAEELSAAGMSDSQYQAYLGYYYSLQQTGASGGGGGRRRSKEESEESLYEQMLNQAKSMIDRGVSVEDVNGSLSTNAAAIGLTVEETRQLLTETTGYAVEQGKL